MGSLECCPHCSPLPPKYRRNQESDFDCKKNQFTCCEKPFYCAVSWFLQHGTAVVLLSNSERFPWRQPGFMARTHARRRARHCRTCQGHAWLDRGKLYCSAILLILKRHASIRFLRPLSWPLTMRSDMRSEISLIQAYVH